jgi:hypothetical protein
MLQLFGAFFIIVGMVAYQLKDELSTEAVLPFSMVFTLMGLALLMYRPL